MLRANSSPSSILKTSFVAKLVSSVRSVPTISRFESLSTRMTISYPHGAKNSVGCGPKLPSLATAKRQELSRSKAARAFLLAVSSWLPALLVHSSYRNACVFKNVFSRFQGNPSSTHVPTKNPLLSGRGSLPV